MEDTVKYKWSFAVWLLNFAIPFLMFLVGYMLNIQEVGMFDFKLPGPSTDHAYTVMSIIFRWGAILNLTIISAFLLTTSPGAKAQKWKRRQAKQLSKAIK